MAWQSVPPPPQTKSQKPPWLWPAVATGALLWLVCAGFFTTAMVASNTAGQAEAGQSSVAESPESDEPSTEEPSTEEPSSAEPSKSAEIVNIEMPSLVGENAAVAEDELERLGFTNIEFGSVDEEHNSFGVVIPANWTVAEQSHEEGETVPSDALIVLGCVKN
ncbi:MAG: PASTA domain-containing protein [Stackebrandtia sp.]